MNNNSKKTFFTKKNIIISISILLVVFLLVYFLFLREPKEKLMKCTFSIDNYQYLYMDITMDAYYTNKVNRVEGKINVNIIDATLKENIGSFEQYLQNYYKSTTKNSININVYRENDNIIVDYIIDYTKFKPGDIDNFDLFPIEETKNKITIDQLKEEILKLDGSCIEG